MDSELPSDRCSIKVDKRIELLSAVQLFTIWSGIGIWRDSYHYKEDMVRFFQPYSKHEATAICEKLIKSDFCFDAPVGLMMHLSEPPELKVETPFSEYHIRRAGETSALNEFVDALRRFSVESEFEEFWDEHLDFYGRVEEAAKSSMPLDNIVGALEGFFGERQRGYHVVLAPVFLGNYGHTLEIGDEKFVYSFLCPMEAGADGLPSFGGALFHEFAHSFVNPLTEEYKGKYRNLETLFKPILDRMANLNYGDNYTIINEHILRAVELKALHPSDPQEGLGNEEARGFVYVRPIFGLLSKYDRAEYRSFREFYPEVVDMLNAISDALVAMELLAQPPKPFKGPINAVSEYRDFLMRRIIVKPTNLGDEGLENRIDAYLHGIKSFLEERFSFQVPIVDDSEALKMDIKDKVLLVYGNRRSNSILAKFAEGLPFEVEGNKIKLGKREYEGENLRLISVCPNPENQDIPMLVYASTKDEGILEIHSLFHGPTDYILYRGEEVVTQGYYWKNGRWCVAEGNGEAPPQ